MQKSNRDFESLDFKALRVLLEVLESGNVSRTAERLGMSQPAASRALERVRVALGDPLIVRTRRGYGPTSRAAAIQARVRQLLVDVEGIFSEGGFDPQTTTRTFRLATTDYGAATALPDLAAAFANGAPRARLEVVPFTSDVFDRLENGTLDAAFYADLPLPPDYHVRELFTDTYACIFRDKHPLVPHIGRQEFMKMAAKYPRAVLMYTDGGGLKPDDVLGEFGSDEDVQVLHTPYFMSAPWTIMKTDLVMCVPLRVAERMAVVGKLVVAPLPTSTASFRYRLVWHARSHEDEGLRWFRRLLPNERSSADTSDLAAV